jgi:hypothetical protein
MFTLKHMNRVLGEIKGLSSKSVFSVRKSRLSYSLSQLNNQHRGAIVEKMIRDKLIMQGRRVKYIGGTNPFDMLVDGQRVEIKSSLARKLPSGRHFYQFQNIKTKNFDKIILVYITPNGIKTKTFTKKTMMKKLRRNKYYSNGKTLAGAA